MLRVVRDVDGHNCSVETAAGLAMVAGKLYQLPMRSVSAKKDADGCIEELELESSQEYGGKASGSLVLQVEPYEKTEIYLEDRHNRSGPFNAADHAWLSPCGQELGNWLAASGLELIRVSGVEEPMLPYYHLVFHHRHFDQVVYLFQNKRTTFDPAKNVSLEPEVAAHNQFMSMLAGAAMAAGSNHAPMAIRQVSDDSSSRLTYIEMTSPDNGGGCFMHPDQSGAHRVVISGLWGDYEPTPSLDLAAYPWLDGWTREVAGKLLARGLPLARVHDHRNPYNMLDFFDPKQHVWVVLSQLMQQD